MPERSGSTSAGSISISRATATATIEGSRSRASFCNRCTASSPECFRSTLAAASRPSRPRGEESAASWSASASPPVVRRIPSALAASRRTAAEITADKTSSSNLGLAFSSLRIVRAWMARTQPASRRCWPVEALEPGLTSRAVTPAGQRRVNEFAEIVIPGGCLLEQLRCHVLGIQSDQRTGNREAHRALLVGAAEFSFKGRNGAVQPGHAAFVCLRNGQRFATSSTSGRSRAWSSNT